MLHPSIENLKLGISHHKEMALSCLHGANGGAWTVRDPSRYPDAKDKLIRRALGHAAQARRLELKLYRLQAILH